MCTQQGRKKKQKLGKDEKKNIQQTVKCNNMSVRQRSLVFCNLLVGSIVSQLTFLIKVSRVCCVRCYYYYDYYYFIINLTKEERKKA